MKKYKNTRKITKPTTKARWISGRVLRVSIQIAEIKFNIGTSSNKTIKAPNYVKGVRGLGIENSETHQADYYFKLNPCLFGAVVKNGIGLMVFAVYEHQALCKKRPAHAKANTTFRSDLKSYE